MTAELDAYKQFAPEASSRKPIRGKIQISLFQIRMKNFVTTLSYVWELKESVGIIKRKQARQERETLVAVSPV